MNPSEKMTRDGWRQNREEKDSSKQKSEIERVQRNERMINSIGRQPRGKILSELRDTSVDVNDNTENDHWEKGRLQDDDGSELHDMASQKNMRARATDQPELADERSKESCYSQRSSIKGIGEELSVAETGSRDSSRTHYE
jgi:hypothetical protein